MHDAVLSMGYGLASFLFAAGIAAVFFGVKAAMKRILKGGHNHDD